MKDSSHDFEEVVSRMKSETWVRVVERDIPFLIRNLIRKGECSPCFNRALGVDIPPIGDATIGNMVYSLRDSPKNVVVALGGMVEQSGYERIAEIRDSCIRTAGELHDFLRGVSGRDDLVHILEGFQERYAYLTSYLLVVVFSERFLEDRVRDLIARMAGEDKVDHYFDALVSVRCFNESTEELLALVSLVEKIIEQDLDSDGKRAREMYEAHATEYGWLATRWYFEQVWDADDIRKRVKEYLTKEPEEERKKILTIRREAEEKTEEFLEKYGLGEEDRSLIDLVKDFVFLRTFRTESLSKANFLVRPVLERVAKKLGISFKDILFLSVDEIIMTLQDDDGLDILKLIRKRKTRLFHFFAELVFVFGVSPELDVGIPRILVLRGAAVVRQVARRAEENSTHVHQFAERNVGEQHADQEEVYVEQHANRFRRIEAEMSQRDSQRLDRHDVHLGHVAHTDAERRDGAEEEEREVVGGERKQPHLFVRQAAQHQEGDGCQRESVAEVERRDGHVEEAIRRFEQLDRQRQGLEEKAGVANDDDQHRPVKRESAKPEPFVRTVDELRAAMQFGFGVAEKRTEEEHFGEHPHGSHEGIRRAFERIGLDPVERFFLATGGRNAERHRPSDPVDQPVKHSQHENSGGGVGNDDGEHVVEFAVGDADVGNQRKHEHGDQRFEHFFHASALLSAMCILRRPSSNLIWQMVSRCFM